MGQAKQSRFKIQYNYRVCINRKESFRSNPEFSKLSIASVFEEELSVPKQVEHKKTRVTVKVPSYLSGHEIVNILEKTKGKRKKWKQLR